MEERKPYPGNAVIIFSAWAWILLRHYFFLDRTKKDLASDMGHVILIV